jgi:L-iditol 2-dehydrogenase
VLSAVLDPTAEFPVVLEDVPEPSLPRPDWALLEVSYGGICGSDLHAIFPSEGGSPVFRPFVPPQPQLGHEIAAVVVEPGPDCPVPTGTRVAVDEVLGCTARGLEPCPRCAEGAISACLRFADGGIAGYGHGLTEGLGAGWSERLVAHASQLHPVPDDLDDRAAALVEPISVAIHALLRHPPEDGAPVLVVGAGMIGLATVAAARALFPASEVSVLARHPHQAAAARRLGAGHVIDAADEAAAIEELAAIAGVPVSGARRGAMLADGFPTVVEAVGSGASLGLAVRLAAKRGVVHLVGAAARVEVDLAPVWFKELLVVGSFCHGVDPLHGNRLHSFERAIEIALRIPVDELVTHVFALRDVRQALEIAAAREHGAIKVLLDPAG